MMRAVLALVAALAVQVQGFQAAPQGRQLSESPESGSGGGGEIEEMLGEVLGYMSLLLDPSTCSNETSVAGISAGLYSTLESAGVSMSTTTSMVNCVCSLDLTELGEAMTPLFDGSVDTEDTEAFLSAVFGILGSVESIMSTTTGICQTGDCKTAVMGFIDELMVFVLSAIPAEWGLPDMSDIAVAVSASAESMWGCVCSGEMQYGAFFDYLEASLTTVYAALTTEGADMNTIIAAIESALLQMVPFVMGEGMLCSSGCKAVFGEMMSLMFTAFVDVTSAYLSYSQNLAYQYELVNGVWTSEWSSAFSAAMSSMGVGMVSTWSNVADCMCNIDWTAAISAGAEMATKAVASFTAGNTIVATLGSELATALDFFFSSSMACGSSCKAAMGDMFSIAMQMNMVMMLYIAPWFTPSVLELEGELDHMLNALAWMGPNVPNSMIQTMGASVAKTADCVCGGTIAFGELVSTTSSLWTEADSLIVKGESATAQDFYALIDAGLDSAGKHLDMLFSSKGICGGVCPTVGDEILDMIPQINTIIQTYLSGKGISGMPDIFPAGAKAMSDAWVSCLCGGTGSMTALTTKARGYVTQAISNMAILSDPSWYMTVAKDIVPFVMGSTMACSSSCTAAMSASLGVMLEPAMVNYMLPYASSMMPDELPLDLSGLVIPTSLTANVAALPYCMCGAIDWTGLITWVETTAMPAVTSIISGLSTGAVPDLKGLVVDTILPELLAEDFLVCSGTCEATIAAITVDVASLIGPVFTALAPLWYEFGAISSLFGASFVEQVTNAMDSGCFCSSTTEWGVLYDAMEAGTMAFLGGTGGDIQAMIDAFFSTITTCPAAAEAVPQEVAFTAKMSGTVETFPLEAVCSKFAARVDVPVEDVSCSVTAASVVFAAKVKVSGVLSEGKVTAAVASMATPTAVEDALELEELNIEVTEVLPVTSVVYYPSPSPPPPADDDGGLTTGAIIGIAVGGGVAVAIMVGIVAYCMCCKKGAGSDPKVQA